MARVPDIGHNSDFTTVRQRCPFGPDGDQFNPFASPDLSDLYDQLRVARNESPVFYAERFHAWIVSRYADVLAILKDSHRFTAAARTVLLSSYPRVSDVLEKTDTLSAPNMGFDGQPTHERLRGPVAKYFSASAMMLREGRIRDLANECLAGIPSRDPIDLVSAFAVPLAGRVIIDLVGLPAADHDQIMRYHEAVNAFFFGRPAVDRQVEYAERVLALEAYIVDVIELRRQSPEDDLISDVLDKVAKGQAQYSEQELVSLISLDIIAAGVRPIVYAIVNLCHELLREPRRWDDLRANPELFDEYFAESLRRRGMFPGLFRVTTTDVEVGGVTIPEGDVVWAMLVSANHDESQFAEPESFDPHRTNLGNSLHFSHGLHYCLGTQLARTVARVATDLLMRERPGLRMTADQALEYEVGTNVLNPTTLLVEW